jgi:hypothetical protein
MSPTEKSGEGADRRLQRRIAVGLPLLVRGTDREGNAFEEVTQSYNVSRTGVSFSTGRELDPGTKLEIIIPRPNTLRETGSDFVTLGRVVRILPGKSAREKTVGVEFLGPRFHRVFVSEGT